MRRLPGLETVIGLNNQRRASGHDVNPRPFSAGCGPGLPFAKQSHGLRRNRGQFVEGALENHLEFAAPRRRLVLVKVRRSLIEIRRQFAFMFARVLAQGRT